MADQTEVSHPPNIDQEKSEPMLTCEGGQRLINNEPKYFGPEKSCW